MIVATIAAVAARDVSPAPDKKNKKKRMDQSAEVQAELTIWLAVLIGHPWCRVLYRKCGGDDVDQDVKDRGDTDGKFDLKDRHRIRECDGK